MDIDEGKIGRWPYIPVDPRTGRHAVTGEEIEVPELGEICVAQDARAGSGGASASGTGWPGTTGSASGADGSRRRPECGPSTS
jgi:hypothetical protein